MPPQKETLFRTPAPSPARSLLLAAAVGVAAGLAVHPYTFRVDDYNKAKYPDYAAEVKQFVNLYKIDGFFTDQAWLNILKFSFRNSGAHDQLVAIHDRHENLV